MQPQNVGSPFERTAGETAGPFSVTKEGNKYRKNVKGYHDGLQDKLPSVHEMLHHLNRMESGRRKTRYDLRDNSVGFQAGDLVWRINDVVYRIRPGPKTKMKIVNSVRLMKYTHSETVDVSGRSKIRRRQYYEINPYAAPVRRLWVF